MEKEIKRERAKIKETRKGPPPLGMAPNQFPREEKMERSEPL
jgi:hypothetical protein